MQRNRALLSWSLLALRSVHDGPSAACFLKLIFPSAACSGGLGTSKALFCSFAGQSPQLRLLMFVLSRLGIGLCEALRPLQNLLLDLLLLDSSRACSTVPCFNLSEAFALRLRNAFGGRGLGGGLRFFLATTAHGYKPALSFSAHSFPRRWSLRVSGLPGIGGPPPRAFKKHRAAFLPAAQPQRTE